MGFALTKKHHDFYHENHHIEFESLLSPEEVEQLQEGLNTLAPNQKWIDDGHDVWRRDDRIKKITLRKNLAEIASNLCKKRPLRLAYDQVIKGALSKTPWNLIELSSIRKVVCGLILQLSSSSSAESPLSPTQKGNGVFFSPFCPLNFPDDSDLFMIVYTEATALYVHEPRDPNRHTLKKLDYVFGDKLLSSTHPIVYRS